MPSIEKWAPHGLWFPVGFPSKNNPQKGTNHHQTDMDPLTWTRFSKFGMARWFMPALRVWQMSSRGRPIPSTPVAACIACLQLQNWAGWFGRIGLGLGPARNQKRAAVVLQDRVSTQGSATRPLGCFSIFEQPGLDVCTAWHGHFPAPQGYQALHHHGVCKVAQQQSAKSARV